MPGIKIDLKYAKTVIEAEAKAVRNLARNLNQDFRKAAQWIHAKNLQNGGRVVCTGMGKAGLVAQKVCASLASTGTPALFMHPTEALHGDLGMVAKHDILMIFSNSGESDEIIRLLPPIQSVGARIIALTASRKSSLGAHADLVLEMGTIEEPCPLRLAPSASTTAMLALGDALALCVLKARDFTERDFARLHPGGSLGRKLTPVSNLMRKGKRLPLIRPHSSVGEALNQLTKAQGGTAAVTDGKRNLLGVFTDGDFRRLMLKDPQQFSDPVKRHMTSPCRSLLDTMLVYEALEIMSTNRINALPVLDKHKKVVGVLDIQDVV